MGKDLILERQNGDKLRRDGIPGDVDAWLINPGDHWYAYVNNLNSDLQPVWYDVNSFKQEPKLIGDTEMMQAEIFRVLDDGYNKSVSGNDQTARYSNNIFS